MNQLLGGSAERYPHALENKFPRFLSMIMSLWDEDEIDEYLMELMVSKRPNRAGFPPDVATDIMHLSLRHAMQDSSTSHEDVWEEIATESSENLTTQRNGNWSEPSTHVGRELNRLNIPCTLEGLFESVQTGNSTAVNLFLEAKVGTEIRNKRGWTPLIQATISKGPILPHAYQPHCLKASQMPCRLHQHANHQTARALPVHAPTKPK